VIAVIFIQIISTYMMYKLLNFPLHLLDDQLLLHAITSHRNQLAKGMWTYLIEQLASNSCDPTNEEH